MDINHISVSRAGVFAECEKKYHFTYHLKMASPKPEPFYFVYGTLVHKIAELYVEGKGAVPIGDIASDILRGKIPVEGDRLCPELPEEYAKKLTKHVRAIKNLTEKTGCGGLVEQEFKYDLDPPNGRCVTGFIDRLILTGDKAFIIDYKTTKKGKWRVDSETVKTNLQLRTYARWVQRQYGLRPENIKAALYYLEGENLIAAQYDEESLEGAEKELLRAYLAIERADPDKVWGRVGWHCKNCAYETVCPFYNKSNPAVWDGDMVSIGY